MNKPPIKVEGPFEYRPGGAMIEDAHQELRRLIANTPIDRDKYAASLRYQLRAGIISQEHYDSEMVEMYGKRGWLKELLDLLAPQPMPLVAAICAFIKDQTTCQCVCDGSFVVPAHAVMVASALSIHSVR